ncbi:MAG: translation initiation factor IF-5A [Candidatus Micrarchaeia archaeon]|jgi:translation initiation factor 5A
MAVDRMFATMNDLREGRYVIIDEHPCRVMSISHSKTGKHGAGKINVVAISIVDGSKHTLMAPSDADVEVPVVERKRAQVVSVSGSTAQLMDSQTFETFELEIPAEFQAQVEAGKEVEYIEAMGKKIWARVSSE